MKRVKLAVTALVIFFLVSSTVCTASTEAKKHSKTHHHSVCKVSKKKHLVPAKRPYHCLHRAKTKKHCQIVHVLKTNTCHTVRKHCLQSKTKHQVAKLLPCPRKIMVKPAPLVPRVHHDVCSRPVFKDRPCYKDRPVVCCRMLRDGPYVGIAGGVDSYRIRQELNQTFPDIAITQSNPALSAVGLVGGIYGGYGKYFRNLYYLGGEVFANTTGASTSYTMNVNQLVGVPGAWHTQVRVNSNFGISLLPGIKTSDTTLLYLRLGFSRLSIHTNESEDFPLLAIGSSSRTNWTSGIAYGIGMETAIYGNWSLRGEYTHTEYKSITAPDIALATETPGTVVKGSLFFPSNNQYMLGISYHFMT